MEKNTGDNLNLNNNLDLHINKNTKNTDNKENLVITEQKVQPNQANSVNKRKNRSLQYNSMFSYLVEVLTGDKPETDKIKSLIVLEQDFQIVQDKGKIYNLFKIFEECFNQSEFVCTPILKGQILMTGTTLLILLNAKDEHNLIFVNFINNVLIEHIKNTNNVSNLYLRQISCQCLEEIENEYPGIMFSLMGRRTLEIFENFSFCNANGNNEMKSIKSIPLSAAPSRRSCSLITSNNPNEFQKIEYKKIELSNDGLYTLIEDEIFYVFQFYLSLYTTILKHMIQFYIAHYNFVNCEEYKQFLMEKDLNTLEQTDENNTQEKNINKNEIYIGLSKIIDILNSFSNNQGNNENFKNISSSSLNNEALQSGIPFTKINQQNLNMLYPKDTILHINEVLYSKYVFLNENINKFGKQQISDLSTLSFNQDFLAYIHKAMSRIIHLLPKTTELIKARIWKLLSFFIPYIEINQMALLPHFNYFHLNANSCILTLITIQIIDTFSSDRIKKNFILKLIIKLCLLVKDQRLNKNLRILVIRWLINLRNAKNEQFKFNKYLQTIVYYLAPTPFDSLELCNEKIKSLFIFFENSTEQNENCCNFIINSISIMDNYKYYPIFSYHIKSLFRSYLYIIVRYPYKKIIEKLCVVIKSNLKEVPRILPNVINLFRIVKSLSSTEKNGAVVKENDEIKEGNDKNSQKISFVEIYKCLLIEMSNFISSFNSYRKLNNYFELFLEISKNKAISPTSIIKGLNNLYNSIKSLSNWKIEKNILEVCKILLTHHDLEIIKQNNLQVLLKELNQNSFDYGIREKAKLYYELVTNVEKSILLQYLNNENWAYKNEKNCYGINEFQITIKYDFENCGDLSDYIELFQAKEERQEFNLLDRGTALFNCGCKGNVLLLSDCLNETDKVEYSNYLLNNDNLHQNQINYEKVNDYLNKRELDEVINNLISSSDILRLFINDKDIRDHEESQNIKKENIFKYEDVNMNQFKESQKPNESTINNKQVNYLDLYFTMISSIRFYIKLPVSIQMKKSINNEINKTFSNLLCFGVIPSLEIISPILLPYLELCDEKDKDTFPYVYKAYLIIYPKVPIPSDIKTRIIFYDKNGKCCTGLLNNLKIVFEDFFLPISLPFENGSEEDIIQFKKKLFKHLWKKFKIDSDSYINTNRTFSFPKQKIITIVKNKLHPFLIEQNFEDKFYIIENPYIKTSNEYPNNYTIKKNFETRTGKYRKSSYDFLMDNFIYEKDRNSESEDTIFTPVNYIIGEVLIFIPEHFHLLFKIKISAFTSIVEIRSDCTEILEYLDDYFDSWIKED